MAFKASFRGDGGGDFSTFEVERVALGDFFLEDGLWTTNQCQHALELELRTDHCE